MQNILASDARCRIFYVSFVPDNNIAFEHYRITGIFPLRARHFLWLFFLEKSIGKSGSWRR
jgi:hypothetical protein